MLNGYFGSNGTDVALTRSTPESRRSWFVGVSHLDGEGGSTASVIILGIVCAKGVR